MTRCIGRVLLTMAFASTSVVAPFAHIHPDVDVLAASRHQHAEAGTSAHHHHQGAHWHLAQPAGGPSDPAGFTDESGHHVSVATSVLAVKPPSDASRAPLALAVARAPRLVSTRPASRPLGAFVEARPNLPPCVATSDRAPPA